MKTEGNTTLISPEAWESALEKAVEHGKNLDTLARELGVSGDVIFKRLLAAALPAATCVKVYRANHRDLCCQLLEQWTPLASPPDLSSDGDVTSARGGKDGLDAGLKAGQFVLKLMERLVKLDNIDATEAPANKENCNGMDVHAIAAKVAKADRLDAERQAARKKGAGEIAFRVVA